MRAEARHQLKQDKFSRATLQVAGQTMDWTAEHKSKLIVGGIIAAAVLAALLGGWYYLNGQDQKASLNLSKALRTMQAPIRTAGEPEQPGVESFSSAKDRATQAHKEFQVVVDQFPHTHAEDLARYFLGLTAADTGDYASAEKELNAVASYRNADLASLAKQALGSVYLREGKTKEAVEVFKALSEKPTTLVTKSAAQLQLADALLADRQPLEAKGIYERVQKENPAMPASQIAAQALQNLK